MHSYLSRTDFRHLSRNNTIPEFQKKFLPLLKRKFKNEPIAREIPAPGSPQTSKFSRNVLEFKDFCVLLPLILEWNARKFARNTLAMLPVMLRIPLRTKSLPDKPRCFQPEERTQERPRKNTNRSLIINLKRSGSD